MERCAFVKRKVTHCFDSNFEICLSIKNGVSPHFHIFESAFDLFLEGILWKTRDTNLRQHFQPKFLLSYLQIVSQKIQLF